MAKLFHPYSRGIVGIPTVLLGLGWIALWLLWPLAGGRTIGRKQAPLKLYHSPVAVTFEETGMSPYNIWVSSKSENYLDEATESPIASFRERPVTNRFLLRPDRGLLAVERLEPGTRENARMTGRSFSPHWDSRAVFHARKDQVLKLLIRPSANLEDAHLSLPGLSIPETTSLKGPWRVVVRIETGKNGRVEHVFLEESSGDRTIDMAVVREMYKGVLPERGIRHSGSIVVNYGIE